MDGIEKLQKDLTIISGFVSEIAAYLDGDTLFWPMGPFSPPLTFGGYLLRQRRLLLLVDLLTPAEQLVLERTIADFHVALDGHLVRFERRSSAELGARLRQWTEYLRDLRENRKAFGYYATAVEPRAMLDALIEHLALPPHQLESDVPARLPGIDAWLQARWVRGDFVWPAEWQPAYPSHVYWYLYGEPVDGAQPD